MSQQAKAMRSQVKKSNVKDKIKLAQNFLHKLRFLSDEVVHNMLGLYGHIDEFKELYKY